MEDYYTIQTPDHHVILFGELHTLQKQGVLCDVILSAEDGEVMAHKVVLMAASKYFREKLSPAVGAPASRIFLKGISVVELANLVKYIYTGKLLVAKETMDITLEVSEILELHGVIKGYKEIITYERMKGGETTEIIQAMEGVKSETITATVIAEQNEVPQGSSENQEQAVPLVGNVEKTLNHVNAENVTSGAYDDDDNDVDVEYQEVTQVHEVQEDGSTICYTIETPITTSTDGIYTNADGISTTNTLNASGEYTFEVNPYDGQYMDVSVGAGTTPRSMPMPKLQKMVAPISSSTQDHQDLLAVAIESLTDSSPFSLNQNQIADNMGSGLESEETTIGSNFVSDGQHSTPIKSAIAAADNFLITDVKSMASPPPVKQEIAEEVTENGTQIVTQPIYTSVATENADGKKTEVYSVSLDMDKVNKPLIMPPEKKAGPKLPRRKKKGRPQSAPIEIPIEAIQNYFEGNPNPNSLRKGGPSTRRVSPRRKTPIKSLLSLEGIKLHKTDEKDASSKSPKVQLKAPVSKNTRREKIGDIEVEIAISTIIPQLAQPSASSSGDVGLEHLPVSTSSSSELPVPEPIPPMHIAADSTTQADSTSDIVPMKQTKTDNTEVLKSPAKTLKEQTFNEKKEEPPKMLDFGQSIDFESDSDDEIIYTNSKQIKETMEEEEILPKSGIFIQPFAQRAPRSSKKKRKAKGTENKTKISDSSDMTENKANISDNSEMTEIVDPKQIGKTIRFGVKQAKTTSTEAESESVGMDTDSENVAETKQKNSKSKVKKNMNEDQAQHIKVKSFVGKRKVGRPRVGSKKQKAKSSPDSTVANNTVDEKTGIMETRHKGCLEKAKKVEINDKIIDNEENTELKSPDEQPSPLEVIGLKKKSKTPIPKSKAKVVETETVIENVNVVESKDTNVVLAKKNKESNDTKLANEIAQLEVTGLKQKSKTPIKKSNAKLVETETVIENMNVVESKDTNVVLAKKNKESNDTKLANEIAQLEVTGLKKKSKTPIKKSKAKLVETETVIENMNVVEAKDTNVVLAKRNKESNDTKLANEIAQLEVTGLKKKSKTPIKKSKAKLVETETVIENMNVVEAKYTNVVLAKRNKESNDTKLANEIAQLEVTGLKKKSKTPIKKSNAKLVETETVIENMNVVESKDTNVVLAKKNKESNDTKLANEIAQLITTNDSVEVKDTCSERKSKRIAVKTTIKSVEEEAFTEKEISITNNKGTEQKTKKCNIAKKASDHKLETIQKTAIHEKDSLVKVKDGDTEKKARRSIGKSKTKSFMEELVDDKEISVSDNNISEKKAKKTVKEVIKSVEVKSTDEKVTEVTPKARYKTIGKKTKAGKTADVIAKTNDGLEKKHETNKEVATKDLSKNYSKSLEIQQSNEDEKLKILIDAPKTPANKSKIEMEENIIFSDKAVDGKVRSSASKRKGKIPRRLPLSPDDHDRKRLQISENIPMVRTRRSSVRSNSESRSTVLTTTQTNDIDTVKDLSDTETVNFSEKGFHDNIQSYEINSASVGEIHVPFVPVKTVNLDKKMSLTDDIGYTVIKDTKGFPKVMLKKHTTEEILQLVRNIAAASSPKKIKRNIDVELERDEGSKTDDSKSIQTQTPITDQSIEADKVPLVEDKSSGLKNKKAAKQLIASLRSGKRKLETIANLSKAKKRKLMQTSVSKLELKPVAGNTETTANAIENNTTDSSCKAKEIESCNSDPVAKTVPLEKAAKDNIFDILSPILSPRKSPLIVPDDMKAMKDNYSSAVEVNSITVDAKRASPVKRLIEVSNKTQITKKKASPIKKSTKEIDSRTSDEMKIIEPNIDKSVSTSAQKVVETERKDTNEDVTAEKCCTDDSKMNEWDKNGETPSLTCTNIPDVGLNERVDEISKNEAYDQRESDDDDDDDDITELSLLELSEESEDIESPSARSGEVVKGTVAERNDGDIQDAGTETTMTGSFECPEEDCEFRTGDPSSLSVHLKNEHYSVKAELTEPAPRPPSSLTCSCCNTKFRSKAALIQHEKRKQLKTLSCDICSKSFHKLSELHKHRFKLHDIAMPETYTRYQCNQCEFVSWSQAAVDNHKLSHEDTRSMVCTVCSKTFKTQYDLTRHMAIHKEKMFLCDKCDFKAVTNTALTKHMVVKHTEDPVEYTCSICSYKSPHKGNLHSHTRNVHGLNIVTKGGRVQDRDHYAGLPAGTLVTEDGGVFSIPKSHTGQPETQQSQEGQQRKQRLRSPPERGFYRQRKRQRKYVREVVPEGKDSSPHDQSEETAEWRPKSSEEIIKALQDKYMKRHEEVMKKPGKTFSFMSDTLKEVISQPSFPQSSPGLRAARVSKLYKGAHLQEMPVVHIVETPQSVVNNVDNEIEVENGEGEILRSGFHETTSDYHFMDNSHSVGIQESVVSTTEDESSIAVRGIPTTDEQVIVIQARDDGSMMQPGDFVQSMMDGRVPGDETTQSLNALSAFLSAGQEEVEIQNN